MRGEVENMKLEKGKEGVGVAGKKVNLKCKGLAFCALVMLFVATMAFAGVVGIVNAQQTLPKGGNSFDTAVGLQPGSYVTDHKIPRNAPEHFMFTLNPGQRHIIEVTNKPDIASAGSSQVIYDDDRVELTGGFDWLPSSEKSLYTLYMVIGGGDYDTTKGTRYDISIEDCFDAGSQTDAGDKLENAMEITPEMYKGYLSGKYEGADAKDFYKMHVVGGTTLTVKMTSLGSMIGFRLYDIDREIIAEKIARGGELINTTQEITNSGDIYIGVISTGGFSGKYTLEITTGAEAPPVTLTPVPTVTQIQTPTPMPGEDPFNYRGEYTLDLNELREEESKAIPYVMKYASEYKVSPCLIMAVIRQESDFFDYSQDPDKDPDKFDIGYMQVSHIAAIDTYKEYTGDEYTGSKEEWQQDGLDPDKNIKYGTRYLRIQHDRIEYHAVHYENVYDDLLESTVSAYNAGHPTKDNEKYVEGVIHGRDLVDGQRRGYEFFLTIRVPVGGTPAPEEGEEGVPGFEALFAIAGLLAMAYLLRRRK